MKDLNSLLFDENPPVFIVAELSANHNQKIENAIKTIQAAKKAGADAIKLQTYTPSTMTIDCDKPDFQVNSGTIWDGITLFELYKTAYTPWEWHEELFRVAREEGIICFSSPFDNSAVDFLEELGNPIIKIASFEITDIPLIKYAASKHKPIIFSTGVAEIEDINDALNTCRDIGNNEIIILKCTSAYPAPPEEANLTTIPDMKKRFNCPIGLSDHSLGIELPILAVGFGAKIIEKHFIVDRSIGGPDSSFSLDLKQFTQMVKAIRTAEKAIGKVSYTLSEKVEKNKIFARSLYVVENIKKGQIFTKNNLRSIRPGYGIKPKYYSDVIGKRAMSDISRGTALSWTHFKK